MVSLGAYQVCFFEYCVIYGGADADRDGNGGGVLSMAAILGIQSLVYKFMGRALEGFTTVIMIELLLGSIMMISMGIIGFYIAKMYEELKGRPRYIIVQKLNDKCGK